MNNEKARFVWVPLLIAVAIAGGIFNRTIFLCRNLFRQNGKV